MSVASVNNRAGIQTAIAAASRKTGVDFNYLLGQAQVESGMRTHARAPTSSASGLYQFIDQSWLAIVKQHGSEHGMGWAADSIQQGANGRYSVADAGMKQAILSLRNDPMAASLMAAEHASDNKTALEGALGRDANGTDLYMAHFLGLGGAKSFLRNLAADPNQNGAAMFPSAARANRSIFYAPNGQPRSLGDIYQRFAAKLDRGAVAAGGSLNGASNALAETPPRNAIAELMAVAGAEVVPGSGETGSEATRWANITLDRLSGRSSGPAANLAQQLMRPTPDTARLAYMMLAQMGGN